MNPVFIVNIGPVLFGRWRTDGVQIEKKDTIHSWCDTYETV